MNRKLRTPADYALIARRLFQQLAAEGTVYAEVILSAGVILWKQQDLAAVFDALVAEAEPQSGECTLDPRCDPPMGSPCG
ncbi:MAG: hypothetical protein WDO18_14915 [Acidobacteriota bacterium]